MKHHLIGVAVGLLVLVLLAGAQAVRPPGIYVEASIHAIRLSEHGDRTELLLVWEPGNSVPIGHAFVVCRLAGVGGAFGRGFSYCGAELHMPLGKIQAAGIRRSPRRYFLTVTGGTGVYTDRARGTFSFLPLLPGRSALRVTLR